METKFTPGPWSVVEDYGDYMVYAEQPREGVELCIASDINGLRHRRADGSWDKSQVSANAHLIAAAPDLHKELAELLERFDPHGRDVTFNGARAALAKARGE